jgi:hypothetical protein
MDKSKMTEAMKKIDAGRDRRVARFDITAKFIAEDFSSTVYFYESVRGPVAIGFRGRSKKTAFNYRFVSSDSRLDYVDEWMKKQQKINETKKVERRKPGPRALQVGDVLMSSWGYDQTNIDYYLVTKLVGSQSVEIVEIGRETVHDDYMSGACIPDKTQIIGKPFRRKVIGVNGVSVRINSSSSPSKKEPQIIGGCEIYDIDRYSSGH